MHPSIKIISLIALAIVIHILSHQALLIVACALVFCLIHYRAYGFLHMLKRVRWLLISMLIIFAFNTPGEYLPQWPFAVAPTYEGLEEGGLQALRLCLMLAAIALLLVNTNRENLMAGFFVLFYPLRYLKVSPERFSARLWLTLHYVEQSADTQNKSGFFERLEELKNHDETPHNGPETIELDLPTMRWRDTVVVIILIAAGIYLL